MLVEQQTKKERKAKEKIDTGRCGHGAPNCCRVRARAGRRLAEREGGGSLYGLRMRQWKRCHCAKTDE